MMRSRLLLPLLLALASCATANPVATASAPGLKRADLESYLPLAVGNEWRFRTTNDDRGGAVVIRIEGVERGFHVDNMGGRFRFDGEGLRDEERYLILLPLEAGHRWESRLAGGAVERYEIVATDEAVEVPAGTFTGALVVRATTRVDPSTELEREWTWVRGVGPVRIAAAAVRKDGRIPQPGLELEAFVPAQRR
ncbi:MAG TPA: hypothetical protein VN033_01610 [Vulgatibacter sp.]|nr:hypothetical protein [Vulgatibacter sp.]